MKFDPWSMSWWTAQLDSVAATRREAHAMKFKADDVQPPQVRTILALYFADHAAKVSIQAALDGEKLQPCDCEACEKMRELFGREGIA